MDLTLGGFRKWLEGLPPELIIAREWTSCDCPLAKYLVLTQGAQYASVGIDGTVFINKKASNKIPPDERGKWIEIFVAKLDRRFTRMADRKADAQLCLTVCGEVEEQLKLEDTAKRQRVRL